MLRYSRVQSVLGRTLPSRSVLREVSDRVTSEYDFSNLMLDKIK